MIAKGHGGSMDFLPPRRGAPGSQIGRRTAFSGAGCGGDQASPDAGELRMAGGLHHRENTITFIDIN